MPQGPQYMMMVSGSPGARPQFAAQYGAHFMPMGSPNGHMNHMGAMHMAAAAGPHGPSHDPSAGPGMMMHGSGGRGGRGGRGSGGRGGMAERHGGPSNGSGGRGGGPAGRGEGGGAAGDAPGGADAGGKGGSGGGGGKAE